MQATQPRRRITTPTALEFEYLYAPEPTWKKVRSHGAKLCLEPACGHVFDGPAGRCPRCAGWELSSFVRGRRGNPWLVARMVRWLLGRA